MFAAFTDRYVNMSQNGADLIGSHHLQLGVLSGRKCGTRTYRFGSFLQTVAQFKFCDLLVLAVTSQGIGRSWIHLMSFPSTISSLFFSLKSFSVPVPILSSSGISGLSPLLDSLFCSMVDFLSGLSRMS